MDSANLMAEPRSHLVTVHLEAIADVVEDARVEDVKSSHLEHRELATPEDGYFHSRQPHILGIGLQTGSRRAKQQEPTSSTRTSGGV